MSKMEYFEAYSVESHGSTGSRGMRILTTTEGPHSDRVRHLIYDFEKKLMNALTAEAIAANPESKIRRDAERAQILALFGNDIVHVKEIPNGYCSDGCCEHLPWFVVTTSFGPITIGWRKSAMNIDWSASDIKKRAEDLFPDEKVTRSDHYIHAWSDEQAMVYLKTLKENAGIEESVL